MREYRFLIICAVNRLSIEITPYEFYKIVTIDKTHPEFFTFTTNEKLDKALQHEIQ